jgi:putative phosphoribosyl transferase
MFIDRHDAGRRLAAALAKYKDRDTVVLALVRGGLPVGFEVAQALGAPLDVILVRKIGAPDQPELAIGAVVDGTEPEVVTNPEVVRLSGMTDEDVAEIAKPQLAEIERRRRLYLRGRSRAEVTGRTVIVVDDGIATGATTRAALHAIRRENPATLVLAVPVAPPQTVDKLRPDADEVVCLETPDMFFAVGEFYQRFHQVEDDEVIELLDRAQKQASRR